MVGGGYDQQLTSNGRLIMSTNTMVRVPGSGLGSPRLSLTPQPQTKSQKAKDEMRMAYQVGRDEAALQRKNDLEDDVSDGENSKN